MNKIRLIIFISICSIFLFTLLYFLIFGVCDGEADVYKLEVKGKLIDKYFYKATHLRIFNGKDTIEPIGVYSADLVDYLAIGDSLFKPSYNDTCYIYKNHDAVFKVIYNYTECPCAKQKKIRKEIDELRSKK